jgi:hypothetical protein
MSTLRTFFCFAVGMAALLWLPLSARADADLDAANQAYEAGHYEDAAKSFQALIDARGYSAALCFDLANAEARAGHLGPALLNYERARYLAPGDAAIEHNLQLVRKQAGLQPDPYRWWQVVLRSINWGVWLGLIIACLVLLFGALVGNALLKEPADGPGHPALRKVFRAIFFICIPLFLFFGFVELSAVGFNDRIEGVIVSKDAALRLSPFDSSEQTGSVHEGELVTIETKHDNYVWVDDKSIQSGWMQDKQVEPIVPGSF